MALLIIVINLFRLLVTNISPTLRISDWRWLPLQYSLGLGPLLFYYVLRIIRPKYTFKSKDLLHFIPLAIAVGLQLASPQLDLLLLLAAFFSLIIYTYYAYNLTESFYRRIKFTNGDRYRIELKWLQRLITCFGILCLCYLVFIIKNYYCNHNDIIAKSYFLFDLLLAMLTIVSACIALSRRESGPISLAPAFVKEAVPSALREKGIWLKRMLKVNAY
jgi:putative ABC transport system permease protein